MTTSTPLPNVYQPPRSPFNPAFDPAAFGTAVPGWYPTPQTVAVLLRARTKDNHGQELGYWSGDTRPTLVEVEEIIRLCYGNLVSCVGPWLPTALWAMSEKCIAILAAMFVELSYFPEQLDTQQSAYDRLKDLFDQEVKALCELAGPYRPDDIPAPGPPGDGEGQLPAYYFGDGLEVCGVNVYYRPSVEVTFYQTLQYQSILWMDNRRPGSGQLEVNP